MQFCRTDIKEWLKNGRIFLHSYKENMSSRSCEDSRVHEVVSVGTKATVHGRASAWQLLTAPGCRRPLQTVREPWPSASVSKVLVSWVLIKDRFHPEPWDLSVPEPSEPVSRLHGHHPHPRKDDSGCWGPKGSPAGTGGQAGQARGSPYSLWDTSAQAATRRQCVIRLARHPRAATGAGCKGPGPLAGDTRSLLTHAPTRRLPESWRWEMLVFL